MIDSCKGCCVLLILFTLVGCSGNADKVQALQTENSSLNAQIASLESEKTSLNSQISSLQQQIDQTRSLDRLVGVWQCDRAFDTDSTLSIKVLTPSRWALMEFSKSSGNVTMSKVGSYTVSGNTYDETVNVSSLGSTDADSTAQFVIDPDGNGMSTSSEHWKLVSR